MTGEQNIQRPAPARLRIGFRVAAGIVLVLLFVCWWESIYLYEGRSLEGWLTAAKWSGSPGQSAELVGAMDHFGGRVMPCLRKIIARAGPRDELPVGAFKILGVRAASMIPELAQRLNAGNSSAAIALGYIGEPAVPALIEALGQTNRVVPPTRFGQSGRKKYDLNRREQIPQSALNGLHLAGSRAEAAVPALIRLVTAEDRDPWSRQLAIWTLGTIGRDPDGTVPVLLSVLNREGRDMALAATQAVKSFPAATNQSVPALLAVLKSNRFDEVQRAAGNALLELGAGAVMVAPLLERLGALDFETRVWAAERLPLIVPDAAIAVPALSGLQGDTNAVVRATAVRALGGYCPRSSAAVSRSLLALNDPDRGVVIAAMQGLGGLGPEWSTDPQFYAECALERLGSFRQWQGELSILRKDADPAAIRFVNRLLSGLLPVR